METDKRVEKTRARILLVDDDTGMDSIEDEEKGLEPGAVDYITKPYRPSVAGTLEFEVVDVFLAGFAEFVAVAERHVDGPAFPAIFSPGS
jgi:hypothetical protein